MGRIFWVILIVALVSGCASVNISGKRSKDFSGKVDSVQVIIVDAWQSKTDPSVSSEFAKNNPEVSREIDGFMKYFASRCSYRWTRIFALNDMPFKVTRASIIQPTSYRFDSNFVLLIQPYFAFYKHGMNNVKFKASITARDTSTVLWEGVIEFTPAYSSENGIDDSVDEFAKTLLGKLKEDGVVTLPFAEIKMPPRELN